MILKMIKNGSAGEGRCRQEGKKNMLSLQSRDAVNRSCCGDYNFSYCKLPSDEMKGRIIGTGRANITAPLETMTGVEMIIDDTRKPLYYRFWSNKTRSREVRWKIDCWRAYPSVRIGDGEESSAEVDAMIREEGEAAALEVEFTESIRNLSNFSDVWSSRTNGYGQNALAHSMKWLSWRDFWQARLAWTSWIAKRAGLFARHRQIYRSWCRRITYSDWRGSLW